MWMTFIRFWYASTNIPFFPLNPPFYSLGYNDFDAETKAAIKAAWGDRDADKLKL